MFTKTTVLLYAIAASRSFVSAIVAPDEEISLPQYWTPPSTYQTKFEKKSSLMDDGASKDPKELANHYFSSNLMLDPKDELAVTSSFVDPVTGLYYQNVQPKIDGIPIANFRAQVALNGSSNDVVAATQSWGTVSHKERRSLRKRSTPISCIDAVMVFAKERKAAVDPKTLRTEDSSKGDGSQKLIFPDTKWAVSNGTCKTAYYKSPDGLYLSWDISFQTFQHYWNFFVSKDSGKLLAVNDWVYNFLEKRQARDEPTFRAIQIGGGNPDQTAPSLMISVNEAIASPSGWFTRVNGILTTNGNNGYARVRSTTQQGSPDAARSNGSLDFPYRAGADPNDYAGLSCTNVFFLTNAFHDIFYQYGFTEIAGNFQDKNFGKGGQEGDSIIAYVQDASGVNNANIATPPDGTPATMRMFRFTRTTPNRDGGLENNVVLHELTHGLTARLTGDPRDANCLSSNEAMGLGEGWSDVVAIAMELAATDNRNSTKAIGAWVAGDPSKGVRTKPLTTDRSQNDLVYSSLNREQYKKIHAMGEIWAVMLYEVLWNLIDQYGYESNPLKNSNVRRGNVMFYHILIEGLKTQPCNPTFIQARDAMLNGDRVMYQGANYCLIYRGFATRGLGANASPNDPRTDDFTLPAQCR